MTEANTAHNLSVKQAADDLEALQAENAQWRVDFKEMVIERDAALARLAEIESTHIDEVMNGLMLEKSLANLKAQEPVGTVDRTAPGFVAWVGIPKLKDGSKLFAAAGASPQPKGLFIDMIAEHPVLAEELRDLDIQPTKGDQHEQQLRPEVHSVGGQQPVEGAGVSAGAGFSGSRTDLVGSITALLSLDAAGALVPHGIGGHARTLLTAAAKALEEQPSQAQPPAPSDTAITYMTGYSDGREWAQQTTAAGAVPCGKTDYQSLLREALVHFYHDGVPTDSEHPKRITVNKIEKALK